METSQVNRLMVEVTRLANATREMSELFTAQSRALSVRGIEIDPGLLELLSKTHDEVAVLRDDLGTQIPELAQLRVIVRTMSMINSTFDLDQILSDVMETFIEITEAERGMIVLIDPHTRDLEFRVIRGMDESTIEKGNFMVSRTVVEDVATKGEPVITTNALEDSRYSAQDSIISYAVRSIICVPLKVKNDVIGVVYSDHRLKAELFGQHELNFLIAFANQAAIAIDNARLFNDVQSSLQEIIEIQNFLDSIFTSIVSGVVTLDNDGIVLTTNRAAEEILGIGSESHNRPYTEVLPALFEGFDDLLYQIKADGQPETVEINPVLPTRGAVNLNMKLSPLVDADSGRTQGVAMVIDDLTESKKNEETLRVVNTYLSEEMVSQIRSIDQIGLGGEDREITALFADVRGFTTFSEQLEPEVLMGVINQYLSVASNAIQTGEGVIDKFMGDAILGLFNTQLNPQQDHAIRTVAAAIMMLDDVKHLHSQLPPNQQLQYGIGIHTGPATIGNVGSPSRKEFTAIGEAIVHAKKLEGTAQGGEIIISEATYELVKDHVDCELEERQLRGTNTISRIYRVLGLR